MADLKHDENVSKDDEAGLTVIKAIQQYRDESADARVGRMNLNRRNRDVYLGRQDWSHKRQGQSREFLPKVAVSVEQMAAFVKRGLVQFGDWYSVDLDPRLAETISGSSVVALMNTFLNNLYAPGGSRANIATILSDGAKNGLLESLMIFKVHGSNVATRKFVAEPGEPTLETADDGTVTEGERGEATVKMEDAMEWRLRIDLIRPEDYYPDPTGNGLYEIHRVERDLHQVIEMAQDGIYDADAVKQLLNTDYPRPKDEERSDSARNQDESPKPSFRKRVVLDEFWGTILNSDGTVAHRNVVATIANDRFLIRPPEPNPFWHQESPFVVQPLVRVPWSVWHKALYDHASQLNIALNEIFNLILDGGIAAVWGIKQVRVDDLEDPSQIEGGLTQGDTLAVKSTLPHGQKVLETVTEGNVPHDAMSVFEALNREFAQAALTNELKLGSMPSKQVRATEVIESSQSQAVTLDGIVSDLEGGLITDLLRKSWMTILQNADELPQEILASQLDSRAALLIMRSSPAERFALLAHVGMFSVHGLSSTIARAREFQKVMALMQAIGMSPPLLQAFMRKYSPDRILRFMLKSLNINPRDVEKTPEEMEQAEAEMAGMLQLQQSMNGGARGPQGEPGLQGEINQQGAPATGMAPNS